MTKTQDIKKINKLNYEWSAKLDRIRLVDMSFGNEYDSGFFKPLGKLMLDNHKISIDRDIKDRYKA